MNGYVYFMRAKGWSSGVKIGFSKTPDVRKGVIQSEVGVPLRLVLAIRGTPKHELMIHRIFHHRRVHGEWFRTDQDLNKFIFDLSNIDRLTDAVLKKFYDMYGRENYCICGRKIQNGRALRLKGAYRGWSRLRWQQARECKTH